MPTGWRRCRASPWCRPGPRAEKCQRCWKVLPDVGTHDVPGVCGRCADAVDHLRDARPVTAAAPSPSIHRRAAADPRARPPRRWCWSPDQLVKQWILTGVFGLQAPIESGVWHPPIEVTGFFNLVMVLELRRQLRPVRRARRRRALDPDRGRADDLDRAGGVAVADGPAGNRADRGPGDRRGPRQHRRPAAFRRGRGLPGRACLRLSLAGVQRRRCGPSRSGVVLLVIDSLFERREAGAGCPGGLRRPKGRDGS